MVGQVGTRGENA